MTTFICTIGFVVFMILPFILVSLVDKLVSKYRRKKYPEYFTYYDTAKRICFDASDKINKKIEYFNFRVKILTEGLNEGECTVDYFKASFDAMTDCYIEASSEFVKQRADSEEWLKKADDYARAHNLKWGILYDHKSA